MSQARPLWQEIIDALARGGLTREIWPGGRDRARVVVHGGEVKPKDKLQERKELAITTGVDALRLLFRDRPELIKDRERGLRLILGGRGPEA